MPNIAHNLRTVMATHDNLTVAQLLTHLPAYITSSQVSNLLASDISARRATRSGQPGSYHYSLTITGRNAAANPNYVRSRFARRSRGQPSAHQTPTDAA